MSGPVVVKVGGSALEAGGDDLWSAIASAAARTPLVLVHGGGAAVDERLGAHGFTSERVGGLRLTPPEQIGIVAGALAGEMNTAVVSKLNALGGRAVGMTLIDGGQNLCINAGLAENDRVGRVTDVSVEGRGDSLFGLLLGSGFLPVVASIGADDGGLLNINADDAAEAVAVGLRASRLVLLSDVAGVLDARGERVSSIDSEAIDELVARGVVTGGMEAKVRAAARASEGLGGPVVIASWEDAAAVLSGGSGSGTIVNGAREAAAPGDA